MDPSAYDISCSTEADCYVIMFVWSLGSPFYQRLLSGLAYKGEILRCIDMFNISPVFGVHNCAIRGFGSSSGVDFLEVGKFVFVNIYKII